MRSLISRVTIVAALAASLAACSPKSTAVTAEDMVLGDPNAKVTVVEYASVACPHCATWNAEVFPAFKAKYIDTGKVKYVHRDSLTGEPRLANAGAMLARCAGKDKYFQVTEALYRAQTTIFTSGDIRGELLTIAQAAGMNEAQFNSCLSDENAAKSAERIEKMMTDNNVRGTPTFEVNGKRLGGEEGGEQTLAQLDAAIAEASK